MAKIMAETLKGNKVQIKDISAFAGTDLLPAEVLIIGCEEPSPPSFSYLDEMLQHINLAGRVCGVFTPASKKTAQYLIRMLKSSEAGIYAEPLLTEKPGDIQKWTAGIIAG